MEAYLQQKKMAKPIFINKIDAVIASLIGNKSACFDGEVVKLHSDRNTFERLKKLYQSGDVKFRVAFAFMGVPTAIGVTWANISGKTDYATLMAFEYPLSAIENGFDLKPYFYHVANEQEFEIALTGLIKTNLTATKDLLPLAKRVFLDMKTNTTAVSPDDNRICPRNVFIGI